MKISLLQSGHDFVTDGRTNRMPKKYNMSSLFMEKTYNSLNVIVFFYIIYLFIYLWILGVEGYAFKPFQDYFPYFELIIRSRQKPD